MPAIEGLELDRAEHRQEIDRAPARDPPAGGASKAQPEQKSGDDDGHRLDIGPIEREERALPRQLIDQRGKPETKKIETARRLRVWATSALSPAAVPTIVTTILHSATGDRNDHATAARQSSVRHAFSGKQG